MATGPYPNFLKFRLKRTKPLNYSDLDNNFRYPNQWEENQPYSEGMMVVSYDFGYTASPSVSLYIASSDHTSTLLNAPGLGGAPWGPIVIPNAAYLGPTGPQGPQGTQGAGAQGFQGFQGFQGSTGLQGDIGTGLQGPQGDVGTGLQGDQGPQGDIGIGAQGFQGAQGFTGSQGFTGFQGLQGDLGTGLQGPQGDVGTGLQGDQGPQGDIGIGAQGFQGAVGTGSQGFQGSTGVTGTGVNSIASASPVSTYSQLPDDVGKTPYGWIGIIIGGNTYYVPAWQ